MKQGSIGALIGGRRRASEVASALVLDDFDRTSRRTFYTRPQRVKSEQQGAGQIVCSESRTGENGKIEA